MTVGRHQKENIYLKNDFISYLQSKNLSSSSITHYVRELALFLAWIDKEEIQITKPEVLKYLEYLKNKRNFENISRARVLNSLNHYFTFLLKNEVIASNPCAFIKIRGTKKKSLYRTFTPEELTELYDRFYLLNVRDYDNSHIPKNQRKKSNLSKQRNAVILNVLINQGTTTKEIDTLELDDLDLMNATLKIKGGRKSNARTIPLQATQIGVLMHYLQNIRPQLLEYHQDKDRQRLFLSLPQYSEAKTDSESIMSVFKPLTKQLKQADNNFLNFKQLRASVITNWLKVHGLRKTQNLAGHRYISSTEKYKSNDLEELINDIEKLHPF
ncbi:MAG: tyrosine-type recombinase/integrase [Flavobacteriales bacterium]|nr:tyrosine-type recombinase/integrase [Flavobacteriales bacterium]